jgi:hypothetical protein
VRSRIGTSHLAALAALRAQLEALDEQEQDGIRAAGVESSKPAGASQLPSPLGFRLEVQNRRIAALVQSVELLTEWLQLVERSRCELNHRVDDQQETLQMLSRAVKELDDPYGFGDRLDEQIAEDRQAQGDDEEWGVG